MTLKNLDEMMLDELDSTKTSFEVACSWLQGNNDKWMTWLPEKGKCNPQFGIYDEPLHILKKSFCFGRLEPCVGPAWESLPYDDPLETIWDFHRF